MAAGAMAGANPPTWASVRLYLSPSCHAACCIGRRGVLPSCIHTARGTSRRGLCADENGEPPSPFFPQHVGSTAQGVFCEMQAQLIRLIRKFRLINGAQVPSAEPRFLNEKYI